MEENLRFEFEDANSQTENQKIEVELLKMVDGIDEELFKIDEKLIGVGENIDKLTNHADAWDIGAAAVSGVLTGLIDSFLIGETKFEINDTKKETKEKIDNFIKWVGEKEGYTKKDNLAGSIRKIEKNHQVANDNIWNGAGIGVTTKSHHLDDLAHHPTLIGLVAYIIVEILNVGIFQNGKGKTCILETQVSTREKIMNKMPIFIMSIIGWIVDMAERNSDKLGVDLPKPLCNLIKILAKVPLAIQILKISKNWVGHIISDLDGTTKTAGKGMGIPGIFLSFLKEISMIPGINMTPFPALLEKMNESKEFDLRSEIINVVQSFEVGKAVVKETTRQLLPVIINEAIVRTFYFVRHLIEELKDKKDFSQVDWQKTIPFGNRTIERMITIATGVFSATDILDATIRGAINSKANGVEFLRQMCLRINFVGIGRFAIAGLTDIGMGFKKGSGEHEQLLLKNQALCLMQAKLYHGETLLWQAQKDANQSISTLFDAIEQNSTQIMQDLNDSQECAEEIKKIDLQKAEEQNAGLLDDIFDVI